jgi:hypothetical protein
MPAPAAMPAPNGAEPAKPDSSSPGGKSGLDTVEPEDQPAPPSKTKSGSTSEGAKGEDGKLEGKQKLETSEDALGEPDGAETSKPKTGTESGAPPKPPPPKTKNEEQPTEEPVNQESAQEKSKPEGNRPTKKETKEQEEDHPKADANTKRKSQSSAKPPAKAFESPADHHSNNSKPIEP